MGGHLERRPQIAVYAKYWLQRTLVYHTFPQSLQQSVILTGQQANTTIQNDPVSLPSAEDTTNYMLTNLSVYNEGGSLNLVYPPLTDIPVMLVPIASVRVHPVVPQLLEVCRPVQVLKRLAHPLAPLVQVAYLCNGQSGSSEQSSLCICSRGMGSLVAVCRGQSSSSRHF